MTPEQWKELETFRTPPDEITLPDRWFELLDMTTAEEEHPDGYNGPCGCKLCRSYADISGDE
jgi:hypothetical protein